MMEEVDHLATPVSLYTPEGRPLRIHERCRLISIRRQLEAPLRNIRKERASKSYASLVRIMNRLVRRIEDIEDELGLPDDQRETEANKRRRLRRR